MLKKGLIFGSIALFLTALMILTGCPTSADDDDSGGGGKIDDDTGNGNSYILVGSVTTDQVQKAIDDVAQAGGSITFRGNVVITTSGGINFKVPATIEGKVSSPGQTVYVSTGGVPITFGSSGKFDLDRDDKFIGDPADFPKATGLDPEGYITYLGPDASSLPVVVEDDTSAWNSVADRVAIGTYTIGEATETAVPAGKELYVVDKISVPGDLTVPSAGKIYAFGAVELDGDSVALSSFNNFAFLLSSTIVITNTDPETVFTLNLPQAGALRVKEIKLGAGGARLPADRLPGGLTTAISGGTLHFPVPNVGTPYQNKALNITGGDGNIEFSAIPAGGAVTALSLGTAKLNNTGTITFNSDINRSAAGDWSFGGNVYFRKAYVAGGDPHSDVVITSTAEGGFTLATGKTIYFSSSRVQNPPKSVLKAGDDADLVITPAATAVLTGDYDDPVSELALTIAGLTIERGSLVVPSNASFTVDGALAITLKSDVAKIVIGDTVISGRPNRAGVMTGVAASKFTLAPDTLSGNVAASSIVGTGHLLITLDPSHAGGKTLTLRAPLELDLSGKVVAIDAQALVINHAGGKIANKVVIQGGGTAAKITGGGTSTNDNTLGVIETAITGTGDVRATVSGDTITKKSATAGPSPEPIGTIGGGAASPDNNATITGYVNTSDFVINAITEFAP